MATRADVLRRFGPAYLAQHTLSTPEAKAWRAIVACRTAALGGHRMQCDACRYRHAVYHSCRNSLRGYGTSNAHSTNRVSTDGIKLPWYFTCS